MKGIYFKLLIIVLIILIPVFWYGILNTNVSLKYETENPGDCISIITGQNLCRIINQLKISAAIDIILIVVLLIYRKKIIRD